MLLPGLFLIVIVASGFSFLRGSKQDGPDARQGGDAAYAAFRAARASRVFRPRLALAVTLASSFGHARPHLALDAVAIGSHADGYPAP
jgi:hypothetical protein